MKNGILLPHWTIQARVNDRMNEKIIPGWNILVKWWTYHPLDECEVTLHAEMSFISVRIFLPTHPTLVNASGTPTWCIRSAKYSLCSTIPR